jgi:AsmA protein
MNWPADNADTSRQRSLSLRRWVAAILLLILALPVAAGLVVISRFDPNRYAPALVAAVDKATGRQLTLGGPITMQFSLAPSLEASNLSLSNPPGFAGQNLVTLSRVEARIALLPLLSHRVDILKLVLVEPNIVLERQANGAANWDFTAAPTASTTPAPAASQPPAARTGYSFSLEAVEIKNGSLTINTSGHESPFVVQLTSLTGQADALGAPLHITAQAALGSAPFSLSGVLGPIERFSGVGNAPWPIDMKLNFAGATANILGTIDHPRTASGYDLAVNLTIPALEALAQSLPPGLLGTAPLPALHNLTASARIVDQNSPVPAIDNLSLKADASDLSALRPGLTLTTFDMEMASLDQPLSLNAAGKLGNDAFTLQGNFGAPQALLNPALLPASMPPQGSFPVSIQAQLGAAKASLKGAIATPVTLSGAALALAATVPDLSALSPAAGTALPAWKNIAIQGTLIDPGGEGLRHAIGLDSLAVTMDNAAFGGVASLYFGPQPRLQLALKFSQANLDALQAAMPQAALPATATAAAAAAPPTTPAPPLRIIPDTKLPLTVLKSTSADMQISADTLVWKHSTYTALQGHAQLANGMLTLAPVTGELPGGSISANATVDVTKAPATETLQLSAPALALSPFLRALGLSGAAEGTIQARITASSSGDDLRAMAANLNGQLGLASVNDVIDGTLLNRLFGTALNTVGLPANLVGAQGPVTVRCAGLRIDATNGIGTIRAMTLDSSRLLAQGGGTIDFGQEKLGIVLRPQVKAGGTNLSVPVQIGGSFLQPSYSLAPANLLKAAAQSAAGLPAGGLTGNSILGKAINLLGLDSSSDVCPAALSLARMGQPGPTAPASTTHAPSTPIPASNLPKNLLNSLLGQ